VPKRLRIVANGQTFSASPGEKLLDAALHQGIALPHECRAGQCGSCLVRVIRGHVLGGETKQRGVIHACQARLFTDSEIRYDALPPVIRVSGVLKEVKRLAPDVRGLIIKLNAPLYRLPGQYCRFRFRGFPTRCFSPTAPIIGSDSPDVLRLHVKIVRKGAVTSKLETEILPGHKVKVEGPFGSAYYRPAEGQRLLLIGSGTGFAPIWAIAAAALRRQPTRSIHVVVGARRLQSLYMTPALCRLAAFPNTSCIATTEEPQKRSQIVRLGTPAQFLPSMHASDIVYAAGAPSLVEAVGGAAAPAGAAFYADPFTASEGLDSSWLSRVLSLLPQAA
jgi:NAD(P)H-flavin reductase/ferredoxin